MKPARLKDTLPAWMTDLLGIAALPQEGERIMAHGVPLVMRDGILRTLSSRSTAQQQTEATFGYKWHQRHTFEGPDAVGHARVWLRERYGDVAAWIDQHGADPVLLDAGCGAGRAALELFGTHLSGVRYLGVDVSSAVDVAAEMFHERGIAGEFLQADLNELPIPPGSIDVILAEGVLHHTDSTEKAFHRLATLLAPGGRFLFYIYRKKGPIREFTDDYIRERLQALSPEEAWAALMPLTKLGKALGELNVEVEVPEAVELLGIPAGKLSLQRLIYWHVFKAFYRPELTLDEMNHINFDWYAPRNAHRHTVDEIRGWCGEAGLRIEREQVQESGITMVTKKR